MICMEIRPENENGTHLGEKRRTNNRTEHDDGRTKHGWDEDGDGDGTSNDGRSE